MTWHRGNCPCGSPYKFQGRGGCIRRSCTRTLIVTSYKRVVDAPGNAVRWLDGAGTEVSWWLEPDPLKNGKYEWIEHWGAWQPVRAGPLEMRQDGRRVRT